MGGRCLDDICAADRFNFSRLAPTTKSSPTWPIWCCCCWCWHFCCRAGPPVAVPNGHRHASVLVDAAHPRVNCNFLRAWTRTDRSISHCCPASVSALLHMSSSRCWQGAFGHSCSNRLIRFHTIHAPRRMPHTSHSSERSCNMWLGTCQA